MSKKNNNPNIRWLKRDEAKLKKAVKRANTKANRLRKQGFDIQNIKPSDIKRDVRTRKEFNKLLKDIDKFTKRGSEKGKKKSDVFQYEIDVAKYKHRTVEEKKAKQLEELKQKDLKSRGESVGYTRGETGVKMGDVTLNSLKERQFKENLKRAEFNKYSMHMDFLLDKKAQEYQKEIKKENYIRAMITQGLSEEMQKLIAFINTDDFMEVLHTDTEGGFMFIYDDAQRQIYEETLSEVWADSFENNKEEFLTMLKNKGADPETVNTLEEMDRDDFLNTVVSNVETYTTQNQSLQAETHVNYNIYTNVNQIKRKLKG